MTTATAPVPTTYDGSASFARFSVSQYQRMVESGILTPDDRVELLENYVVLKMSRNPPHDGTIHLMTWPLTRIVPAGWTLRSQLAIELSDSQPEPDFAVVRGNPRSFLRRHPLAAEVGLVIEIASTSLLRDQRDKARIYARAGIAVYWIVNLDDDRIEVHTGPSGPTASPAYANIRHYLRGDQFPLVLDGLTVASVAVADLLP